MGIPPNWLLWVMALWYSAKVLFFLFVIGAKCWSVTFGAKRVPPV